MLTEILSGGQDQNVSVLISLYSYPPTFLCLNMYFVRMGGGGYLSTADFACGVSVIVLGSHDAFFTLRPNTPNKREVVLTEQVASPSLTDSRHPPRVAQDQEMNSQGLRWHGKHTGCSQNLPREPQSSKPGPMAHPGCGKKHGVWSLPVHTPGRKVKKLYF